MKRVCLITILPKIRAERSAGEVGAPGRGPAVRPPWAQADFPSQTGSVARGPRKGVPAFGASCANWNKLMGRVRPSPALQRGFEALSGIVCQFVTGRNRPLLVPHCAPEERPPPPAGRSAPCLCAAPRSASSEAGPRPETRAHPQGSAAPSAGVARPPQTHGPPGRVGTSPLPGGVFERRPGRAGCLQACSSPRPKPHFVVIPSLPLH